MLGAAKTIPASTPMPSHRFSCSFLCLRVMQGLFSSHHLASRSTAEGFKFKLSILANTPSALLQVDGHLPKFTICASQHQIVGRGAHGKAIKSCDTSSPSMLWPSSKLSAVHTDHSLISRGHLKVIVLLTRRVFSCIFLPEAPDANMVAGLIHTYVE